VNLSDIAGQGRPPSAGRSSASPCPAPASPSEVASLYDGMRQGRRPPRVVVVGGDTSVSPAGWFVNVTLLGEHDGSPPLRSAAKPAT